MSDLFWKSSDGQIRTLVEYPFDSEMAFEQYLLENQYLIGDVFVLGRQIRTGNNQGVLDVLAIDQDKKVCIVELKNQEVSEAILPQVLGYAMWAESNPDSIKALWLQAPKKPEIDIDWDNLEFRIIIAAPSYGANITKMATKIGYDVDLVQVKRFRVEQDAFLLVDKLQQQPAVKVGLTQPMPSYDRTFYESFHGKAAVDQFLAAVASLERLSAQRGWKLESKLNKYYAGFKYGTRVCFAVHWDSTHQWSITVKVPREIAAGAQVAGWEYRGYDDSFHEGYFRSASPQEPSLDALTPLLQKAFSSISGIEH